MAAAQLMMTTKLFTFLLGLAGAAAAQTYDAAINQLRSTASFHYAIPPARALKDQILAAPTVSNMEVQFAESVVLATTPPETAMTARLALLAQMAAKGNLNAAARRKVLTGDYTGWTAELVQAAPVSATIAAGGPFATAEFQLLVFNTLADTDASSLAWQKLFKKRRAQLPLQQQLELTFVWKQKMLALPDRNAEQNAFMASLSADLMALSLQLQNTPQP